MVYSEENYKNAKSGEVFEFVCEECGRVFYKTKQQISKNKGVLPKYCSQKCDKDAKAKKIVKVKCKECGEEYGIEEYLYQRKIKQGSNFFCSRSCAAKYNNKKYPKKKKKVDNTVCPKCARKKYGTSELCKDCETKQRTIQKRERELGSFIGYDKGKYLTHKCQTVRKDARFFMENESKQEKVCKYCHNHEFDDILEVHHIKSILSFDRRTKLKEINNDDNLVWLCPNHHAMLELGIIDLNNGGVG